MPHAALEAKITSLQVWVVAGLAFMLVTAVGTFSAVSWIVIDGRGNLAAAQHRSNQALACYVIPQMDRALKTLPTLSYYRDNPRELASQLALIREQKERAIATWGECDERDGS